MKRRDLLKGAGLVLGAPLVGATAFLNPNNAQAATSGQKKNLVVTFAGPFCFWQDAGNIKVMAPPVGRNYEKVPHQPWIGTTTNETVIDVPRGTALSLTMEGYTPPPSPQQTGTPAFIYEQGAGNGATPLFNLMAPVPNAIIGVHPTVTKMVCASGVPDPTCTQFTVLASGLSFLYHDIDLDGVRITTAGSNFFKPCFTNDESLHEANLGIHLTPLDRHPDPDHGHAKEVWGRMLSMYPWMQAEISGIDFCPDFDTSICAFDPKLCGTTHKSSQHQNRVMVGPGGDCQVPVMMLHGGEAYRRRKR